MSYILEALKKSDAERKRGEVPTLGDAPQAPAATQDTGAKSWVWLAAGGFGVAAVAGLATMVLMGGEDKAPSPSALTPPPVAHVANAQAQPEPELRPEPAPAPEAVTAPAPEPEPIPVAKPAPKPDPVPASAPTPTPAAMPAPQEVRVLSTKPAPAQTDETAETKVTVLADKVVDAPAPVVKEVAQAKPKPKVKARPKPKPKPSARTALPKLRNAAAYVDRAWASMDKGLYAQAIDDLDRAVVLEPNFADAWFAHGWANEKNGDERAAIQDYSRTIDTKPDHAFALFSRGFLNLYGGNTRGAVVDFVRTQGVATDDSLRLYSRLWLYLSRSRAGQDAPARLKEDAALESLAQWPGPLVLHFFGALDEGAVVTAIENGPKAGLKERRATGYFFLGISKLEAKNRPRARAYFEKALATGAVQFRQYDAAGRELERLDR